MADRTLRAIIKIDGATGAVTVIKNLDDSTKKLGSTLTDTGKKISEVGGKLTTHLTLPIVGLGALMVKTASDAEEMSSKFSVVFSKVSQKANEMAKTLDKSYGLSEIAAKSLMANTGDLLTGFGFTQESAADLSFEVQKLAVDLASFTNYSGGASGASEALTKALLGEREMVKSLGISILEEDVQKQMAVNTANNMTFATERQAKAYATLQLAQKQSKNAIGDYARTQDSFANQLRETTEDAKDLAVSFGKELLPFAKDLLAQVKGLVGWFKDLDPSAKKTIITFAGIAAAAGPVVSVVGGLTQGLGGIVTVAPQVLAAGIKMGAGLVAAMGPVGLAIAGITLALGGTAFALTSLTSQIESEQKRVKEEALPMVEAYNREKALGKKAVTDIEKYEADKRIALNETNAFKAKLADAEKNNQEFLYRGLNMEITKWEKAYKDADANLQAAKKAAGQTTSTTGQKEKSATQIKWEEVQATLKKEIELVNQRAKIYGDSADFAAAKQDLIKSAIDDLLKSGFTAESAAIKQLSIQYSTLGEQIKSDELAEETRAEKAKIAGELANKTIRDSIDAEIERQKIKEQAAAKMGTGNSNVAIQNILTERDSFIKAGVDKTQAEAWAQGEITRIQNEESQKRLSELQNYYNQYSGYVISLMSSIGTINKNASDEELFQIGQKYDARKEEIENTVADEKEKDKQLKDLEKQRQKEEREIKLKAFNEQKGFNTGQAIMSGIAAAVESFNRGGGFPWGLIPMAASIATTAGQIMAIQSETPKFAQGFRGTMTTTGPQLIQVGDNPGGRERLSVEAIPESSYGTNAPGRDEGIRVELFGMNWDYFLAASKDGRLRIHENAIQRR